MNKRQRLVQEKFLDNEEQIISSLEKTYTTALNDVTKAAKSYQDEINSIQAMIDTVEDEKSRATLKTMQQSKIYQKQYQDAMKKQISGILDKMHAEEFKDISSYLKTCYEDGFIGTVYDLHGQGIPLIMPIDQEAVIRAVQTDSKISKGLYSHLGEDVAELKKTIASEISRGIATGARFSDIALQIKAKMKGSYQKAGGALYRSQLIARTEGHRVQIQGTMDSCYKAKERGADIVKQWDSTLDDVTRESHQMVDGEIRELDEKFSNGLMYPGDSSGGADEVCNCRCALLQRARAALDKAELDTLKDRADFYGLDKTKNFDEFKEKYLKAVEDIDNTKNYGKIISDKPKFDSIKLSGIDADYVPEVEETFNGLMNDYPLQGLKVKTNKSSSEFGHFNGQVKGTKKNGEVYGVWNNEICISKTSYVNKATSREEHLRNYKYRKSALENASRVDLATIPHEYAHAIDTAYVLAKDDTLRAFAEMYKTPKKIGLADVDIINQYNNKIHKSNNRLSKEIFDELQQEYNLDYMGTINRIDKEYGSYASSSISEFLAEAFANMRILEDKDKTDFMKSFEKIFNRKFNEVLGG